MAEKELKDLSDFAKNKGIDKIESYDTAYLSNMDFKSISCIKKIFIKTVRKL